jgi:hypothetical protein
MASVALVVVESGSDWPPFVRGAAHDVVALSQTTVDLDSGALQRACARAQHLRTAVRLAVLACGGEVDDASIHRRALTSGRLLAAVAHATGGQLVLSARDGASAALRLGLIELASTLSNTTIANLATVSVRVGGSLAWFTAHPIVVRSRSDVRVVSYSHNAWNLDTNGFKRPKRGHVHERKCLPS